MVYMEYGCHRRWMSIVFSFLCILVSIGMGNMTQINSAAGVLETSFHIPPWLTGMIAVIFVGIILIGGRERILNVTEKIVPIMAIAFLTASVLAIGMHIKQIPAAFQMILEEAFTMRAGVSGVAGYGIGTAIKKGIARGVFASFVKTPLAITFFIAVPIP